MKSKSTCAPNTNVKDTDCTCFTKEHLLIIADEWNKYSTPKIKVSKKMKKCQIWERMTQIINTHSKCKNEQCWLDLSKLSFISRKVKEEDIFKPLYPNEWFSKVSLWGVQDSTKTWLTSTNINKVMKQYQKDGDFEFLGVVPIDFESQSGLFGSSCVASSYAARKLCSFSLDNLKKDTTHFGFVINTGKDGTEGEHWIAMYCSLKRKRIIFFDSTGHSMPQPLHRFKEKLELQGRKKGIAFKFMESKKEFQAPGTAECGVYAIHFLVKMLHGMTFSKFVRTKLTDRDMITKRAFYFNKYK